MLFLERSWLVFGRSVSLKGVYADLNAGVVVGRDDAKIYNLSFQCNASYVDSASRFNIRADNEFDPGINGEPDIIWAFHQFKY